MKRRDFFKKCFYFSAATIGMMKTNSSLLLPGIANENKKNDEHDLVMIKNGAPGEMVQKAIELLGGISKFVKKGDTVVIKPNIGWARRAEQAANTNPEVVAEIVKLCRIAGAGKIKVFDHTCNEAKRCYTLSGIADAARAEGANVSYIYQQKFKMVNIPKGKILKSWEFYKDALDADVFINVPIVKHHSLSKITMGMKNIMGIIGGRRGEIHNHFNQKIVDLNTVIKPQLTILDGVRVILRNGPQGGNLNDVREMKTIIAGVDIVAVDSLGATLLGLKGSELEYLVNAHEMGLGEFDLNKVDTKTVDLAT